MLRNKKFQLIISLLIAVACWLYVVGDTDPTITSTVGNIQVQMTGEDVLEDLGMSASLDGPNRISITVKGNRSKVNALNHDNIRAVVDVSNCEYGENEEEIQIILPDDVEGVTIEKMSDDMASFTVE